MKKKIILPVLLTGIMLLSAGCGKKADSFNKLETADREYYQNYNAVSGNSGYGYTSGVDVAAGDEAYYDEYADEGDYYEETTEYAARDVEDVEPVDDQGDSEKGAIGKGNSVKLNTDMLVYRGNINIETKDFDAEKQKIKDYVAEKGGIIEEENSVSGSYYNTSRKSYNATIRIPSEQFNDIMSGIEGFGNVVSSSSSVENMSKQYEYNNRQIDILKAKQEAYITALASITDPVDMANVEASLAEIQQQILYLSQQQSDIETDVAYSYVYVNITEVVNFTTPEPEYEKGFFGTMKEAIDEMGENAFNFFVQGLLYFVISNLPILIFWGIIIAAAIFIIRLIIKKRAARGRKTRLSRKEKREIKNVKKFAMMQNEYNQALKEAEEASSEKAGKDEDASNEDAADETAANEASKEE